MSTYSGNTPKNRNDARAQRRDDAEERNDGTAKMRACGHVHGDAQASRCEEQP